MVTAARLVLGLVAAVVLVALLASGGEQALPYFVLVVIALGVAMWFVETRRG